MTAGGPGPRDLRHRARHRLRRDRVIERAPRPPALRARRLRVPRRARRAGAARRQPRRRARRDGRARRRHRLRQDHAHRPRPAAVRRDRRPGDHRRRRRARPRPGHLRALVATAFEEPTLFSMSARENLTLGRARRRPTTRSTQALEVAQAGFVHDLPVGPRHPHRRAGHVALRRPAAAPRAGPRGARAAAGAGARRHALRPRRAHREAGRGGAAPGARRHHRPRRRPPRLHRAARRPGRPAPGRHDHPRRRPPRAARDRPGLPRPARGRRRARGDDARPRHRRGRWAREHRDPDLRPASTGAGTPRTTPTRPPSG